MSKIFTSITGKGFHDCLEQIKDIRNAELRLDLVDLTNVQLQELWTRCQRWMITVRHEFTKRTDWEGFFESCIKLNPEYIDIEGDLAEDEFDKLISISKQSDAEIIISYHNYQETPSYDHLKERILGFYDKGADVVKLACMAKDYEDNVTLLKLYGEFNRLITIGMGDKGKVSRLNALYFGEQISYAASSKEKAAAPGQMTYEEMRTLEEALKCE